MVVRIVILEITIRDKLMTDYDEEYPFAPPDFDLKKEAPKIIASVIASAVILYGIVMYVS